MVVEAQLGMNFPYNKELQERNRLLSQMDVITHNPQWLGGGKLRDYALPGQNGAYPLDRGRLLELQAMGGAFNLTKFLRPTMKVLKSKEAQSIIKPLTDAVIHEGVRYAVGGKISRSKKAKKWTNYAVDTANKGLDLASKANQIFGGKISRSKKAKKWTDYSVDTISRGLDLGSKAKNIFGFGELGKPKVTGRKPRVPQAVNTIKSGGGRGRAVRAEIVKKIMADKGLGMIAASKYVKEKGLY